jgi:ATP-dependent helicase IRC3
MHNGSIGSIPDPISILYTDEDDPFTLASNAQKPGHINTMSGFSWVGCGDEIFVIEIVGRGFIRIERNIIKAH